MTPGQQHHDDRFVPDYPDYEEIENEMLALAARYAPLSETFGTPPATELPPLHEYAPYDGTEAPGGVVPIRPQRPQALDSTPPPPVSLGDNLGEDGIALAFSAANPDLRYVAEWGNWLEWDGVRWAQDRRLHAFSLAREVARRLAAVLPGQKLLPVAAKTVASVLTLAKSDPRHASTPDEWDVDDWALNTPGGIVDLRTGQIRPNEPSAHMTKTTLVEPDGSCPTWDRFLREATGGDAPFVAFLQRVAGYCATGSTKEHAMFFIYGTGGNGKGVFINTIQAILGDYATVSGMDTFTESRGDRHPTDLAYLRGARLVLAQETEAGRSWAESRIKAITGGDPITARFMRGDFFTFAPKFKLLIAGNHKPRLRNVDAAIKRRLHLLPFDTTIPEHQRDPDLPAKLLDEAPGIMRWIVRGTLEYLRLGLAPPPRVLLATEGYFADENLFEQWLEECCEVAPVNWERPASLFSSWTNFASAAGIKPGTKAELSERLSAAGFEPGKANSRGGRYWDGLKLVQPPEMGNFRDYN